MRFAVVTFGCRVNQADSLGFEEALRAGCATPAPPEVADIVVVNTCSVTATADQGARQTIRRIARENPSARIVVTGCYATRCADDVAALPGVETIVANDDKPRLLQIAGLASAAGSRSSEGDGPCGAAIEPGVAGRTAFTLRVQTGCAEACSYCIIPATRGAPRSVPLPQILEEVARVLRAGFKEVALTGVHLGSYGRDLTPASSLDELLAAIDAEPFGQALFRVSSLEPMDCTAGIVDRVAASPRLAPHFHLPLQHASDRLLNVMRRPYALDDYARLVDRIRERIPHASIGSDLIVGFPSESDADFDRLEGYLARSPLTHVHVFPYSDRPGTAASRMDGKVPGAVVRERARRVRQVGRRLADAFYAAQIGTLRPALTLEDGSLVVTDNYLKLRIPSGRARNEWVQVRIEEGGGATLM
jgi:threonylcarbamoyladenosine tRNA methylthiotransferase MtaB